MSAFNALENNQTIIQAWMCGLLAHTRIISWWWCSGDSIRQFESTLWFLNQWHGVTQILFILLNWMDTLLVVKWDAVGFFYKYFILRLPVETESKYPYLNENKLMGPAIYDEFVSVINESHQLNSSFTSLWGVIWGSYQLELKLSYPSNKYLLHDWLENLGSLRH